MKFFSRYFESLIFIVLLSLAFTAFSEQTSNEHIDVANIYGVKIKQSKLYLQVMSNGCTQQSDFLLEWQANELMIKRLRPDHCKRLPILIWLSFDLPEISEIKLLNSIKVPHNRQI